MWNQKTAVSVIPYFSCYRHVYPIMWQKKNPTGNCRQEQEIGANHKLLEVSITSSVITLQGCDEGISSP